MITARVTGLPREVVLYEGQNILPASTIMYDTYTVRGTTYNAYSVEIPEVVLTVNSQGLISRPTVDVTYSTVTGSEVANGIRFTFTLTGYRARVDAANNETEAQYNDYSAGPETESGTILPGSRLTIRNASTGDSLTAPGITQSDGSVDFTFTGSAGSSTVTFNDPGAESNASLNLQTSMIPTFNVIRSVAEYKDHVGVTSADDTVDHTGEELTVNIDGYTAYHATNNIPGIVSATGYQWYMNGTAISGATQQTYTPTEAGSYYVEVDVRVTSGGNNYDIEISSRPFTLTLPAQGSVESQDIPADDMPLVADEPLADTAGLDIV